MALIRTDYGLIYNTDGSLCATLLPEGGVSVAEATENAFFTQGGGYASWLNNLAIGAYYERSVGNGTVRITRLGVHRFKAEVIADIQGTSLLFGLGATGIQWPGGQSHTISAYILDYYEAPGTTHRWGLGRSNVGGAHLHGYDGTGYKTFTYADSTTITGYMALRTTSSEAIVKAGSRIEWEYIQVELNRAYGTPFVEGTRAAGTLSYPDLAEKFNQREFTFAAWWKPYTELGIGSSISDRFFQIDNGTITTGNRIWLTRVYNSAGLRFEVPNADGSGGQQYSFYANSYPVNAWHFIACVLDVPNMKARIHLNDEYQEFPLTEVPAILDLQRFFLGCVESRGQLNGELKNVLLRPYAVSPETIATWHSLDAPFFDPREQYDSISKKLHGAGWNADQNGFRSNVVDPETERPLFEITPDGNAYFGGVLRAGLVQSTSSAVVAASNASFRMKAGADLVCDGTGDQEEINAAIGE